MKRPLLILILTGVFSVSCTKEAPIPKETMVDIYHDMYLLDQNILRHGGYDRIQDSLLIYEPIFNRYGYTFDDYTRSVNIYLDRPDKFAKVFEEVRHRYEARIKVIEDSLDVVNRNSIRWSLIDSVRTLGPDSALTTLLYRCLDMMFFKKDTALLENYPMPDSARMASWKRNVFELYTGDPFSDTMPAGHLFPAPPDTAAVTKAVIEIADGRKDAHTREIRRKLNNSRHLKMKKTEQ